MRRVGKGFSGKQSHLIFKIVVNTNPNGEGSANPTDPHHTPTIIQPSTQPQKTQKPRKPKRKDTQAPQPSDPSDYVADEAVHKELGGGPRYQETMGDTIAQTRFENVSNLHNDSLLARERRVKKLEKKSRSRTHKLKRLYKMKTLPWYDADNEMFDVNVLNGEEVFVAGKNENDVEEVVDVAQDKITLAQALEALKTSKPKVKGIVFQEPGKSTTTTTISSQQSQDKGKGIMIEEPVKPMKKKDLIRLDKEVALKLQAEFDEEERLAKEKAEKEKEANTALIETWDDIQAKIDDDH
ncbi:hypothetical protein Tco_1284497 [Tanacetum coccineum]